MDRERLMHLIEMVMEINDHNLKQSGRLDNYAWCSFEFHVHEIDLRVFNDGNDGIVFAHLNGNTRYTLPNYRIDPDLKMGEEYLKGILEVIKGETDVQRVDEVAS